MSNFDERNLNAVISVAIAALIFVVLIIRLWQLQVIDHNSYYQLSRINAARSMPVIAPRGIIYDRFGKVLVGNRAAFSVYILQTEVKDMPALFRRLSRIISLTPAELEKKVKEQTTRIFDPILIKEKVPIDIVARIEEEKGFLSGVVVSARPVRFYPYGSYSAHVLGYVGEVTAAELEKNTALNMRPGELTGKAGVEKIYDAYLRGINLIEKSQVKGAGESVPGKNIRLTLDIELQKVVEGALGGNTGAVIVLDPRSGDVLAMSSHPSYDPNIFSGPISQEKWNKLFKGNHPFLNRAISAYPPGSTFKMITLSAALEKALFSPSDGFFCPGYFKLGTRVAKCWKAAGHRHLNLLEGLVQSCDVVFYQVGLKAGPDIISDFAKRFGFGKRTGVDLPGESEGIVPAADWKKKVYKESWYPGDSINFAIGQGFLWVTPLQLANAYALIANGKEQFEPHVLANIEGNSNEEGFVYKPRVIADMPISEKNLDYVKSALRDVVDRGTGRAAKVASFEAAGKTGTAENAKAAHAWFVCYAPYDNAKIVIVAFVEHGQHGDQVTARIARKILEWYGGNRE